MTVGAVAPQERSVSLDGSARPMYRVASLMGDEEHGVHWLSWNREQIRWENPARRSGEKEIARSSAVMRGMNCRVYVQSHAYALI